MVKKQYKYIYYYIFIIIITIISIFYLNFVMQNNKYKDINNLIIIAHPGDEVLWSGAALYNDNYLVVCISCGNNIQKDIEFIKVIHKTNNKYLMLNYKEYEDSEQVNWNDQTLYNDLKKIINRKNWSKIITHNPDGEYGNYQHKIISKYVTELSNNNLYYFNNYHTKKEIKNYYNKLIPITEDELINKENLIRIYSSSKEELAMFNHYYVYEQFIKYNDWSSD